MDRMLIREQRLARAARAMRDHDVDLWISYGRDLISNGEPMLRTYSRWTCSGRPRSS